MEESRSGVETNLWDYVQPLSNVVSFNYLRRLLTVSDENWNSVVTNFWKAQRKWEQMSRIMGREGAYARTSGNF